MTEKIEWKLCPVTKYEVIRTYSKSGLRGEEGGAEMYGTFDTEDQANNAIRVFQQAEGMRDPAS